MRAAPNYDRVMAALKRRYRARAASDKASAWECLVFTMLSARSRDDQTEVVFRDLLRAYPTPAVLAAARVPDVAKILSRIGLFRAKARNVVALAKKITAEHGGRVPQGMDALVALPGVGRKTASCVLVYAFGESAIAVDTHVLRVSNRLGWVRAASPEKTETQLRARLPQKHWLDVNRVMVEFGRDVCKPQIPQCWRCPVAKDCAFPRKTAVPAGKPKLAKRV